MNICEGLFELLVYQGDFSVHTWNAFVQTNSILGYSQESLQI